MSKAVPVKSEQMQALPVFSKNGANMKLDFKLKVEASGQELSVQRVASGDVPSQPDLTKAASPSLNLKIEAAAGKPAEFEISTVDSALVIVPTNQAAVELLTSDPTLVIASSIVQGQTQKPESFDNISSVVLPAHK
jgi:hypothetical protein